MTLRVALAVAVLAVATAGCAGSASDVPGCDDDRRLAIVAQSVEAAAYVPCVDDLPAGWRATGFEVTDAGTSLRLDSDRAEEDVHVELAATCDLDGATPTTPSGDGIRTYVRVRAVSPTYEADLLDVFPGGCVRTSFAFERGAHVALVDELRHALGLRARSDLRRALHDDLGITLDG